MKQESTKRLVQLTSLILINLFLCAYIWVGNGLESRVNAEKKPPLNLPTLTNKTNDAAVKSSRTYLGQINPQSKVKVLIMGDSHAKQLSTLARYYSEKYDVNFTLYSFLGCPPIFGTYKTYTNKDNEAQCAQQVREWAKFSKSKKFDYVILSSRWNWLVEPTSYHKFEILRRYLRLAQDTQKETTEQSELERSKQIFESQVGITLRQLQRNGSKVILFTQVPHNGRAMEGCDNVPDILFSKKRFANRCNFVPIKYVNERGRYVKSVFSKFAEGSKNVTMVNTQDAFCDDDRCVFFKDGVRLRRDDDHINRYGALELAKVWEKQSGFPFSKYKK